MSELQEARVGTTNEERAELREAMARLQRVKARLVSISNPGGEDFWFPTEVRLLEEALDRIGQVVAPGSARR